MVDLILTNLISNTIAYSPVGAAVTLEITLEGAQVTLTLANPNADLQESDLSRVFDRFWRKDEARHVEGHAGLGLALVRAYGTQLKVKCAALIDAHDFYPDHDSSPRFESVAAWTKAHLFGESAD